MPVIKIEGRERRRRGYAGPDGEIVVVPKSCGKGRVLVDLKAILEEKKKKANENNRPFPKNAKTTGGNNNQRQMPMRKSGRGK